MFPFRDELYTDWSKGKWEVWLQCRKSVVTVLTEISLHCTPEEYNEVQFTAILGQEYTQVTCSFNDPEPVSAAPESLAVDQEYGLCSIHQHCNHTSHGTASIAPCAKAPVPRACALCPLEHPETLNGQMERSSAVPAIPHTGLFPSRSEIHTGSKKIILRIHRMPLRVIYHN